MYICSCDRVCQWLRCHLSRSIKQTHHIINQCSLDSACRSRPDMFVSTQAADVTSVKWTWSKLILISVLWDRTCRVPPNSDGFDRTLSPIFRITPITLEARLLWIHQLSSVRQCEDLYLLRSCEWSKLSCRLTLMEEGVWRWTRRRQVETFLWQTHNKPCFSGDVWLLLSFCLDVFCWQLQTRWYF